MREEDYLGGKKYLIENDYTQHSGQVSVDAARPLGGDRYEKIEERSAWTFGGILVRAYLPFYGLMLAGARIEYPFFRVFAIWRGCRRAFPDSAGREPAMILNVRCRQPRCSYLRHRRGFVDCLRHSDTPMHRRDESL